MISGDTFQPVCGAMHADCGPRLLGWAYFENWIDPNCIRPFVVIGLEPKTNQLCLLGDLKLQNQLDFNCFQGKPIFFDTAIGK